MAKIVELNLSKEDYLEIARVAALDGQVEKAIINLNKALRLDEKYLDASLALCHIYNSIHDIDNADSVLFKALSLTTNKNDEKECYNQLAYNHIDIKDFKTAEYYIYKCDGDFVFPDVDIDPEELEPKKEGYTLYNKDGDDENQKILERAYEALRERAFEDVIMCADRISENSPLKKNADYLVLITLMLKENFQAVIDNGKMIIEKRGESLQILSTIATAYWLMDNKEEAYKLVDHILEKTYTKEEDILQLLPLLVNTSMHVNVVQYTKIVLEHNPYQKDIMMWCAEGLYNIGQVVEAKKMFNSIKNIFGYKDVDFYLYEISLKPETLEYSITIPQSEKIRRLKIIQELVKGPIKKFKTALKNKELHSIIDWVIEENNIGYLRAMETLIRGIPKDVKDEIIKKHLLDMDMPFDKLISLFTLLLENDVHSYEFDVVCQGRFKRIKMNLPNTYFIMPPIVRTAVTIAICEILQADEQADEYIQKLVDGLNSVFFIEDNDIRPLFCSALQLKRIKNVETLVGVLIANTYKAEALDFDVKTAGDFAKKHGLDEKKFDRYYTMIYGDKYDY